MAGFPCYRKTAGTFYSHLTHLVFANPDLCFHSPDDLALAVSASLHYRAGPILMSHTGSGSF